MCPTLLAIFIKDSITLLLKHISRDYTANHCLSTIWIYTTLKLPSISKALFSSLSTIWIYTTLKQKIPFVIEDCVCLPYEFTLLSNHFQLTDYARLVCLPYEFTLLSNIEDAIECAKEVCLPYEFTLLSNQVHRVLRLTRVCLPYEFTLLSNCSRKYNQSK